LSNTHIGSAGLFSGRDAFCCLFLPTKKLVTRCNERELLVFFGQKLSANKPVQAKHAHFSGIFGTGTTNSWQLLIGAGNSSDV
jgi:hypothetical protein